MRAGDRVLLSEIAAGRDDHAFPDADRFVIDRNPNRHVSFGMGLHRCVGSHLARIEFAEMLTQILRRLPDYELDGEPQRIASVWARAFEQVPLRFT